MPGISRTVSHPRIITPQLQKIRRYAAIHPDEFIQNPKLMKVINKEGVAMPFNYTYSQHCVANAIAEERRKNKPLRLFILKSRQVGLSTQILARFFVKTWAQDNLEALVIAHQEVRAQELIARCKAFYNSMPAALQLALAQDSKAGHKYADTRGTMTIVSAKNIQAARGGTKQLVHFSEFAYYTDPMDILIEIEQLVTRAVSTELIIETTGRGRGSQAHDFWNDCKLGKESYIPIFLAWQDDPECTWRFTSDRDRDMKLAEAFEYEPRLKDRMLHFKLSPGNVFYSYQVLREQVHGNWEFYLQEYPCDEDEAWRSTGQSFFGSENLNLINTAQFPFTYRTYGAKTPIGTLFSSLEDLEQVDRVDENGGRGFFKIWKEPHPNGCYVISGDSAQGEADGNFSSSYVVDMHTFEMMAEFHGRVRPDEHAYAMVSLSDVYNDALLAPEFNAPGNVTLDWIKRINPAANIYRWRWIDDHKARLSNKLGWQTTSNSRPMMLALAKRIVEDVARGKVINPGIIKSRMLIDEMKTFVVADLDGRPEAASSCNDDRVIAWAIALIVASQETYGSANDVLSLYRTSSVDKQPNQANYENGNTLEPKEVIQRLNESRTRDPWNYSGEMPDV